MSLLNKHHRKQLLTIILCTMCIGISYCKGSNVINAATTKSETVTPAPIQTLVPEPEPEPAPTPEPTSTPEPTTTVQPTTTTKVTIFPDLIEEKFSNGYVKVRKKASKKSSQKFLLKPGEKVKVVKKMKKWSKVRTKKGTGYVQNKNLSPKKSKAIKHANKKASRYTLTGYCSCYGCSEGWGTQTKSGRKAKANHTIAADLAVLPLYTEVYIEGMGKYTVEDVGGGVKGKHIDVYCKKHSQCYNIQPQAKVFIIE